MAQRVLLVLELKRVLKERGITYAQIAKRLELSLPTVKRLFSNQDFSLARIDEICDLAGIQLADLVDRLRQGSAPVTQLTVAQEEELMSDPKLFLMTYLVMNRWRFEDIVKAYELSEREVRRLLIRLDRLRIIELQPGDKVRLLVTRSFAWRPDGPVQRFLNETLLREFFASPFDDPRAEFRFFASSLTPGTLAQIRRGMLNVMRDTLDLAEQDSSLPIAQREGAALVLALRPWHYSGFQKFRRRAA
jgi:AcrR family transcriptional regulator